MAVKAAGADLAFKGGVVNGTRGVAGFSAAGTELSGNAYARISMALNAWNVTANGFRNTAKITFPRPTPAAWLPITHWGLYSQVSGGNLLLDYDSTDTAAPQLGAEVGFLATTFGWDFSGGKILAPGALKMCNEGLVSGTRYITLHSGATPGGGNFIDQPVQVAEATWSVDTIDHTPGTTDGQKHRRARNGSVINFGAAITDLPALMSLSLRDGANGTSAAVLWGSTYTTAPDNPDLGDTLSLAENAVEILIPID